MNYSTTIRSSTTVLKQIYFNRSDNFLTLQLNVKWFSLILQTHKEQPLMYPNGIPDGEVNPNNPLVRKKELIWTRADLYFYSSSSIRCQQI